MTILERTLNDVTILELGGHLALEGNLLFREQARAAIDGGARKLIVDMANVEYMDGSGLGALTACYMTLRKVEGRLKLLHLNNRLQQLLTITRLTTVFETFDSESVAVASFSTH